MWQPDGWGQTRIGLLTPHADIVPEAEFGALAPDGISIHAARIPFGAYKPGGTMEPTIADAPVRAMADPPAVDDAAEMLAMAPLHAIVFGHDRDCDLGRGDRGQRLGRCCTCWSSRPCS